MVWLIIVTCQIIWFRQSWNYSSSFIFNKKENNWLCFVMFSLICLKVNYSLLHIISCFPLISNTYLDQIKGAIQRKPHRFRVYQVYPLSKTSKRNSIWLICFLIFMMDDCTERCMKALSFIPFGIGSDATKFYLFFCAIDAYGCAQHDQHACSVISVSFNCSRL